MQAVDKTRWAQLSPLLDELLELEPEPRAARLRTLREADEAAADVLADLLGRLTSVEREGFLETPAMLPEASMAGESIGAYTLERELGQGGMGSVWLARRTDGRYEGRVAVKFLNMALMARGGAERFAREGNILARLAHPNIARLVDAGVARGGQPYLVLEYIDGEPIDRYCDERALDTTARVRLFLDVLGAVAHAHNRLILHRDIKPGNILVTQAGEVKLLDFGIAKLMDDAAVPAQATELTQLAGRAFTPAYAAPEQVEGGDVTTATDVYALGVLLYVLLGGAHPTAPASTTSTPLEQLRAVVEIEPKRLSEAVAQKEKSRALRGDLDNIVAKALKKAPGERYANASAFADDLQRFLNDEPIAARPDAATYLVAKFVRRHRLGVAASAAIVLALAGGVATTLWQAREARQQQVQAEGLIEFMLGDLRKKLQPVGRLDVLDAVGERALAYYDAQEAAWLDPDSLGRRARALHLIGEITESRGNLDGALKVFQQAAESTGQLLERKPTDGQRVFDHAQSMFWIGYVDYRRGRLDKAELAFKRYLLLAQRLTALDPSRVDWQIEEAYANNNVGTVLLGQGRARDGREALMKARAIYEKFLSSRPDLTTELISNYGWLAKAEEQLGSLGTAISLLQSQLAVHRGRSDFNINRDAQRDVAIATHELARLELGRGRSDKAERHAQESVAMLEELSRSDRSNKTWQQELGWAYMELAEAQLARRYLRSANVNVDNTLAIARSLAAQDPSISLWHLNVPGRALLAAVELSSMGMRDSPLLALEEWLSAADRKSMSSRQRWLASRINIALGDLYLADGRQAEAHKQWVQAKLRLESSIATSDPMTISVLAHAQLRLGELASARALAAHIRTTDFRHPAYVDLMDRLSTAAKSTLR